MRRAENCVNAQIAHIYFEDDSLVFEFSKSKGHQDGEDRLGPWHAYEKPNELCIYPLLALTGYMLTYPERKYGKGPLFEGKDQYSRYTKIFPKPLQSTSHHLKLLVCRKVIWELIYQEKVLPRW